MVAPAIFAGVNCVLRRTIAAFKKFDKNNAAPLGNIGFCEYFSLNFGRYEEILNSLPIG